MNLWALSVFIVVLWKGVQSLKEVATFVAEFNNDQDGVARELQKLYGLNLIAEI